MHNTENNAHRTFSKLRTYDALSGSHVSEDSANNGRARVVLGMMLIVVSVIVIVVGGAYERASGESADTGFRYQSQSALLSIVPKADIPNSIQYTVDNGDNTANGSDSKGKSVTLFYDNVDESVFNDYVKLAGKSGYDRCVMERSADNGSIWSAKRSDIGSLSVTYEANDSNGSTGRMTIMAHL